MYMCIYIDKNLNFNIYFYMYILKYLYFVKSKLLITIFMHL